MKGVDYYYSEFEQALVAFDPIVGKEFGLLSKTYNPREVFLWLEKRRLDGQLPPSIESHLTDFYWEIA